jgi:drug/metabolite transporter (DMT)-like permease
MQRPGTTRIAVQLTIGIIAVSCGSIFIRLAAAPALSVAAYRTLWASLLFAPVLLRGPVKEFRGLAARDWCLLTAAGAALSLHFGLWIASLSYTSVASSVLLVDTTPFFIGLSSRWALQRPPGKPFWVGLAVAFAGCLLIFGGDWSASRDSLYGNVLSVGGAIAMAVYLLTGAKCRSNLSLMAYVWPVYASAALFLTAAALFAGVPLRGYSGTTHFYLFLLALVPQCIGHTTYNWSLRWLSPSLVALAGLAEPLGAGLLAWLVLGESLTRTTIAGGVVVLIGIYIATRPTKKEAA